MISTWDLKIHYSMHFYTVLLGTLSVCFRPNDGEKTEAESSSLLSNLAESKITKLFFSKETVRTT